MNAPSQGTGHQRSYPRRKMARSLDEPALSDSLPESGLPWPRDQNQRESNAELFLIDSGIHEASDWGVAQRSSTEGIDPLAPGDAAKPAPTPSTTNHPTT